ncbi:MAG: hypothetical protein JSR17_06890 [Proteobacteria bacterium]|nr:hypothetical protein [Pseudomonadota bacterium]
MSKGPLLLSRNNALPTVLAPAKPAPKEDAEQEIIQLCLELFGANKEQAHKLLPFILHRGNQTLENRIAELQTLYFNSNEDVVRLIDRLNNNASKKLGANL